VIVEEKWRSRCEDDDVAWIKAISRGIGKNRNYMTVQNL
jgi:hypothetical protein